MKKFDFYYKKLCPFKWYVLNNFPFIEATFDAITEYELYCKLVEYVNKVIADMNDLGLQTENLTNAFIELENYVNNYFATLDVQEEINAKLDEMVEDGTLAEIINQEVFAELNQKISNDLEIHFIKTGDLKGDCVLIKTKTKAFLYDLSMETNYQYIANYLQTQSITHIDGIIISHFHYDHIGGNQAQGFLGLISSSYVDDTTEIYLPTTPDFTQFVNDPATDASNVGPRVQAMMAYVINGANAQDLTINYMSTGDILTFDNVVFRFLNCSETQYASYYDVLQTFDGEHYCTTYNNFSMVLEIRNINNTTLLTGDIEQKSEELLAPFINRKITLKKLEHHGSNAKSDTKYLIKTNADLNVVMNGTIDYDSTALRPCYGYIFMTGKNLYSTIENNSMKFIDNGNGIYSDNQLIEKKLNIMSVIGGLIGIGAGGIKNLNLVPADNTIQEDDDLDDYINPGDYICYNGTISATVTNQPNSGYGAFKLTVEQINNVERYTQRLVYNNVQYIEFVRTYTGSWSNWERIQTNEHIQARFTNNITISDTAYGNIPIDTHSETGAFEVSGNKIVCKKAGDYKININLCYGGSAIHEGDRVFARILQNGSGVFTQQQDVSGSQQIVCVSGFILHLSTNDELQFQYRNNTDARGVVIAGQSFISIYS